MSTPQNPPPSSHSPIPPPPPRAEARGGGCLRVGLIGCGVVVLLGIVGVVATGIWWKRNSGDIQAEAQVAAREGARFGIAQRRGGVLRAGQAARRRGTCR